MNNDAETLSKRTLILNGLIRKNPILAGGAVISQAIAYANTLQNALTLSICFSAITFFTLIMSSFIPRNIVYSIRIFLYVMVGGVIYVPVIITLNFLMPGQIAGMGFYLPLLITNTLIVSRSETSFFKENKIKMLIDIVFCIIGYDLAVLIIASLREIASTGAIGDNLLAFPVVLPALSQPFGGFLFLGVCIAIFRTFLFFIKKWGQTKNSPSPTNH